MIDFKDHEDVMRARREAQEVEHDRREKQNECIAFVTAPYGQWEDSIYTKFGDNGRPRYQFDNTETIIDKYHGEITQNDFNIRVSPAGMGASKGVAKLMAGLVKNTESLSGATDIYSMVSEMAMISGYACMRIEQDWADPDSFDQDLFIRNIHDATNRVWFLGNYQERTCADAPGVIVEHLISYEEYKDRFNKKEEYSCRGLGQPENLNAEYYRRHGVRVAEVIYKEKVTRKLYQLPDGTVMNEDDFNEIDGDKIEGVKSKDRESYKIMTRWFDGDRFLNDAEETVFDFLPVIPVLPKFKIIGDKPVSKGVVEGLMDWQRVRNYTGSALVEETALAPKDAIFMTFEQAEKSLGEIGKLNIAGRPVFRYKHHDNVPPPYKPGAYQPNMGLVNLFGATEAGIQSSAGMFAASLGDNPSLQSGVAIDKLDNNSNLGMVKFVKAIEVALSHAGKILVNAYPKLYDTEKERRIINDDGTFEMVKFGEVGINGERVNDLSEGVYDVVCSMGPAQKNRQEKTTETILALGKINPNIIAQNEDILLKSIDAPGMDMAAERSRANLIKARAIPQSQWTDEEIAQAQAEAQAAAQNPPPPDPALMIAQAELQKAENETIELELKALKEQREQQKLDFEQQKSQVEMLMQGQQDQIANEQAMMGMLKQMAEVLKIIGESREKDVMLEGAAQQAYDNQAQSIAQLQQDL